jgi:hypothetical protein
MITCVIQYTLDPHAIEDFERYATTWPPIIKRCGGELTGFYLPKEGANDFAIALRGRPGGPGRPGRTAVLPAEGLGPEAERVRQARRARRGDAHTAAARAVLDPAQPEQPGRDRGGQRAVQVPAALGPVDALPREATA